MGPYGGLLLHPLCSAFPAPPSQRAVNAYWVLGTMYTSSYRGSTTTVVVDVRSNAGGEPFDGYRTVLFYSGLHLPYSTCVQMVPGACTDTLTCTRASCQMQRRLSICDCSTSSSLQPARLQLHLQAPGKTCLSPSEASSAGQTDPIDSTRLDST